MIYLRPLVKKLTSNEMIIEQASLMNSDEEIMDLLLSEVSIDEVEATFTNHYGMRYEKIDNELIDSSLLDNLDKEFLLEKMVIPYRFDSEEGMWYFAISDLTSRSTQKIIVNSVKQNGHKVTFTFAFPFEVRDAYSYIDNNKSRGKDVIQSSPVSGNAKEWVETVINDGIRFRASDIHIEREKVGLRVRYRIDGVMAQKRVFSMSESEMSNIYVRLKIIGNMDISEKRRNQDGRINDYEYNGEMYSMRVSTINTIHGEKFVMRVLSESGDIENFSQLGFSEKQEKIMHEMIHNSNGIIYLAGATGSGKTTTLYAMIDELDKESLNIYTIENPSEKTIDGISQIQVDEASGNTYSSVLKALLRQDPDVMVVGEIREAETSRLAVQASLTGHLVMTTVHANNALDSINRLLDMGVESYLIGSSSVGFISQKLVRVLCPHCKRKVDKIPEHQEMWIKDKLKDFDYETHKNKGEYIYESVGCDECVNGYKGRIAVLEIIKVDNTLKSMISKRAESKEMEGYLYDNGYVDMKQDGILKALKGITSVEELMAKIQG